MTIKLWTAYFMRISIANLVLFASLYMLFPSLPTVMSERLGTSATETGILFLFYVLGMFLIGPFHAYLVDAYKRKYVYMISFALLIASTFGYAFIVNMPELFLLCIVQGVFFGMVTTAGITLAIDITRSTLRSTGNIVFLWMARLGMIIGIVSGGWIYQSYSFRNLLMISAITGIVGILVSLGVYVPFRAPIVTKLYSFDRFLLLRAWVPAINLILITFIPGLFMPLANPVANKLIFIDGISVPSFVFIGSGFLLALFFSRLSFLRQTSGRPIVVGLGLEVLAIFLLKTNHMPEDVLMVLGIGLGFVIPKFLTICVKLSRHCQRGTANTTHLLASELGMTLGVTVSCCLHVNEILFIGQIVTVSALLFFILVTYPYYRKMRVR